MSTPGGVVASIITDGPPLATEAAGRSSNSRNQAPEAVSSSASQIARAASGPLGEAPPPPPPPPPAEPESKLRVGGDTGAGGSGGGRKAGGSGAAPHYLGEPPPAATAAMPLIHTTTTPSKFGNRRVARSSAVFLPASEVASTRRQMVATAVFMAVAMYLNGVVRVYDSRRGQRVAPLVDLLLLIIPDVHAPWLLVAYMYAVYAVTIVRFVVYRNGHGQLLLRRFMLLQGLLNLFSAVCAVATALPVPLSDCSASATGSPAYEGLLVPLGIHHACDGILFNDRVMTIVLLGLCWHHYARGQVALLCRSKSQAAAAAREALLATECPVCYGRPEGNEGDSWGRMVIKLCVWTAVAGGCYCALATRLNYTVGVALSALLPVFVFKFYHYYVRGLLANGHDPHSLIHSFIVWMEADMCRNHLREDRSEVQAALRSLSRDSLRAPSVVIVDGQYMPNPSSGLLPPVGEGSVGLAGVHVRSGVRGVGGGRRSASSWRSGTGELVVRGHSVDTKSGSLPDLAAVATVAAGGGGPVSGPRSGASGPRGLARVSGSLGGSTRALPPRSGGTVDSVRDGHGLGFGRAAHESYAGVLRNLAEEGESAGRSGGYDTFGTTSSRGRGRRTSSLGTGGHPQGHTGRLARARTLSHGSSERRRSLVL